MSPFQPFQLHAEVKDLLSACRLRLIVILLSFAVAFTFIIIRLFLLGIDSESQKFLSPIFHKSRYQRQEITDRNLRPLAINLETKSLYANPKKLLDIDGALIKLKPLFPDLNYAQLKSQLNSKRKFVWIKRNLSPKEQYNVNALGIPGLLFTPAEKRIYPYSNLTSHIVGFVDVDNNGIAGIEKSLESALTKTKQPVTLSIDVRIQHIMHQVLSDAIKTFNAIGGVGIMMDVHNGEIIALVNLPDFDPHFPGKSPASHKFNRSTLGVYELGSVFKSYTLAMGLDSGTISLSDQYDVSKPISVASFKIRDFHPKKKQLSVAEIFMLSSNIGTAKIAIDVGKDIQQHFLEALGLLTPLNIELLEKGKPLLPDQWRDINMMTISYGHGIAVTPLHIVQAFAPLVNGGIFYPATLLKQPKDQPIRGAQIMSKNTSNQMRKLLRLVVTEGTGKFADAKGYLVGGKTGTAEKQKAGVYQEKKMLSSFLAAFPMHKPQYVIFAMLDEPKGIKRTGYYATGGMTAAPVIREVVSRAAPILAIRPMNPENPAILQDLYVNALTGSEEIETH